MSHLPALPPSQRLSNGRFGAGNSGRPRGARNRVAGRITTSILENFEANHEKFLKTLRERDPDGYLNLITGLLPKTAEAPQPDFPDFADLTDEQVAEKISDMRIALDLIEQGSGTFLDLEAVLLSDVEG